MEFRCITSPTDAEDQNELKFSVNNENVAVLNSRSTLYALSAGRVCVTVSTPRVSRRFYVSVLPSVSGLEVSTEHLDLPYGAEAMIYCQILPENASPKPTVKWICSDSSVFVIRGYASNRCHIESVSFGTATLICRLEGTGIEKQIEITTPKRRGCYVATAVYGSYDCPEVWTLRRFRDQYLAKHLLGRAFISAYYAVSPRVVAMFGKTEWFNRFWRARLDKMVKKLQDKGYEQTPYTGD